MAKKSVDIETPDGVCDSYTSYPDTGGPFPPVLFYQHWDRLLDLFTKTLKST